MKITGAAASVLSLLMLNALATPQDNAFQKIAQDYIEQYLRANPEDATELGDHRFDGQLTDYSAEARAKELAAQKEFREKLSAIDGSQLTGANNVDFRILKENIDYQIFRSEELKEPEWNPSFTCKAWPTVCICWLRAILRHRNNGLQICASAWKRFPT